MFRATLTFLIILAATALASPSHAGDAIGGGAQLAQAGGEAKPLTKDEIRDRIIGNTLRFAAPSSGRTLTIYFSQNGEVFQKLAGGSKIINGAVPDN